MEETSEQKLRWRYASHDIFGAGASSFGDKIMRGLKILDFHMDDLLWFHLGHMIVPSGHLSKILTTPHNNIFKTEYGSQKKIT